MFRPVDAFPSATASSRSASRKVRSRVVSRKRDRLTIREIVLAFGPPLLPVLIAAFLKLAGY